MQKILTSWLLLVSLQLPAVALSATTLTPANLATCGGKQVAGRIETVLVDSKFLLDAKLDTGATMTSLSASDIKKFTRVNKTWLRFTVMLPGKQTPLILIAPLLGYTHILNRQEEMDSASTSNDNKNPRQLSQRPVIALPICLGKQQQTLLVNLTDRSHFQYPMLLGTNALKKFHVLVDVGSNHLMPMHCSY
jgi:hypothetical protein